MTDWLRTRDARNEKSVRVGVGHPSLCECDVGNSNVPHEWCMSLDRPWE